MIDLSQAQWRKASKSGASSAACVEIAVNLPGITAVRDSVHPERGAHVVDRGTFAKFLSDVKAGRFDI